MKKILALTMALVLVLSLGACGKAPAAETKAPTEAPVSVTEKATETEAARPHFDKLTLEFVPSKDADVIIADEAQFFSPEQIDQLRRIVDEQNIPVLCFGLRTDFLTHFFPGARRLMELADSITEIKTVCACGRKATVNARIDGNGRVITEGGQILLGGNDSYVAMCHKCWVDKIRAQKEAEKA